MEAAATAGRCWRGWADDLADRAACGADWIDGVVGWARAATRVQLSNGSGGFDGGEAAASVQRRWLRSSWRR
ncbi:hypothetical protein M0R45_009009 [Rubus argutus]|uniref:Uncharacterized protein n=1 Tax=Rubus argutus TaxID=59490 RepID=A0AAW1Y3A3_RUBAR